MSEIAIRDTRVDLDKYSHKVFAQKYYHALDEFLRVSRLRHRDWLLETANYMELDGRYDKADAIRREAITTLKRQNLSLL